MLKYTFFLTSSSKKCFRARAPFYHYFVQKLPSFDIINETSETDFYLRNRNKTWRIKMMITSVAKIDILFLKKMFTSPRPL